MSIMRKVWTYKRKGIKGWWVGWYESGKRKAKALQMLSSETNVCFYKTNSYSEIIFAHYAPGGWLIK